MPTSLVSTGVQFPDNTIQTTAATAGGSITATASGSISNGGTVAVNSDGTVSGVTTTVVPLSTGAAVQVGSFYASQQYTCQCAVNATTVVAFTRNQGNGYFYGYVGTASGTTVTWGTQQLIASNNVYYASCAYNAALDRIAVYGFEADSYQWTLWLISRSGNTLSVVTSAVPWGVVSMSYYQSGCTFDAGNDLYTVHSNNNYNIYASRLTLTTSSISLQNATSVASFEAFSDTPLYFDPIANTCMVVYTDGSSYGCVRTINSSLSGTKTVFSSNSTTYPVPLYVPTLQRPIIVFRNGGVPSNAFAAVTGLITSNVASFNPIVNLVSGTGAIYSISLTWDATIGAVFATYTASTNNNVFGGTITFTGTTPALLVAPANMISDAQQASMFSGLTYLSGVGKSVSLYNVFSTSRFSSRVATAPGNAYNAPSFIGFSSASYTNGQTATINVVGSTNSSQAGLTAGTKYYVQNDGTLSSSATTQPYAGIALSSTRILVKG